MRKFLGRIYISQDASAVAEREFLVLIDAGCEASTRRDFLHISKHIKKPIKYAFLTHHHWDHTHNLAYFREKFPGFEAISNRRQNGGMKFQSEEKMLLGDTEYLIVPTPGHSPKGEDICIWLPDKKVLFTGDLCQPQGPSFEKVRFCTPVPYFHDGLSFISSLEKALSLEPKHVITGHGGICRKNALETTLEVAERIRDIAKEEVRKSRSKKNSLVAKTIFERISWERNFHGVHHRLRDPYYQECDVQGILYWVKRFRGLKQGVSRMQSEV